MTNKQRFRQVIVTMIVMTARVFAIEQKLDVIQPPAEAVPEGFVFIQNAAPERFGAFGAETLRWPTAEEIKTHAVHPESHVEVRRAVETTLEQVGRILKPEWLPSRADLGILALTNSVAGYDAVRFRYRIKNSSIQVTATTKGVVFLVKADGDHHATSREQAIQHMSGALARYFQESEKIKETTFGTVIEAKGGYEGRPSITADTFAHWWGLAGWWTDGCVFALTTPSAKMNNRSPLALGVPQKAWFRAETQ